MSLKHILHLHARMDPKKSYVLTNGKLREIQKLRRTLSAAPSILLPALEKMHNALAT